jgi:hypothetical protein
MAGPAPHLSADERRGARWRRDARHAPPKRHVLVNVGSAHPQLRERRQLSPRRRRTRQQPRAAADNKYARREPVVHNIKVGKRCYH